MPVNNTYRHYKLSSLKRNVFNVPSFAGVDFSSQAFNVASQRAVRIKNYLYKNGIVRKRNGYEQIFKVNPFVYRNTANGVNHPNIVHNNGTNFNGIWKFLAEDGLWHVVAHIGNLLFEIKNIDSNNDITIEPIIGKMVSSVPYYYKFEDYKSSAFVGNNRLWFLGGNLFMCLRFFVDDDNHNVTHLYPVSDNLDSEDETERPFIPTTTISITNKYSIEQTRSSLDYPNKLTYWRKNKLLTGIKLAEEDPNNKPYYSPFEYVLDSPILFKNREQDVQKMSLKIEYSNLVSGELEWGGNGILECVFLDSEDGDTVFRDLPSIEGADEGEYVEPDSDFLYICDSEDETKIVGFVYDINREDVQAKVVLYGNDYVPPIAGSSNVEIVFPCYYEKSADEINKCHFGILFGSNNAQNRLFLSGNPDVPNADWHSNEPNYTDYEGEVMKSNGNFSYFSDVSVMYYGETDNKIVGYEIVSNDKLLVLKSESDKEKTIYFRTPTLVTAIDASGTTVKGYNDETLYDEEFALIKGNGSVAGISPKTIVNFNGDTLFIDSNNQLVGLDVEGILGDNQRYANTRSQYIDRTLEEMDLSDSVVWTDNNYLFISIKDFGIFATNFRTYNKDTKQYEWFVLTCENPTAFLKKDDTYYFGNDKGELYKVNKGSFEDIKKIYCEFTLNYVDGKVVVDESVVEKLNRDESYTFRPLVPSNETYLSRMFYKIAVMSNTENDENADILIKSNGHIEITNLDLVLPEDGVYYLSTYDENDPITDHLTNIYGARLKLEPTDDGYIFKKKTLGGWTTISLEEVSSAILCGCLEDEDVDVEDFYIAETEALDDVNTITLSKDGQVLEFISYGDQTSETSFKSEIKQTFNVEAYYLTAPFILGSLENLKTIYSFTITNDAQIPSELEVGFASNKLVNADDKTMSYVSLTKEAHGFDFGDFNFQKMDYDRVVVSRTYTFHRVLARQKFICFAFRNSNNTDSVLSGMSVTYSTPFPSYSGD